MTPAQQPTPDQKKRLLKAKIAVALQDETGKGSVAKIATGRSRAAAATVQAAIWNSPAMKLA